MRNICVRRTIIKTGFFFLNHPLNTASLTLEYFEEMMTCGICCNALTYCHCFLYHNRVFLFRLQQDISALTLLTSM